MEEFTILQDLVILIAVAIPVVALAQRFRIPSVVGFLATGVLIGPHALALIHDLEAVQHLAEIGVILLLFVIGLELSLSRIIALGPSIVRAGALQVGGTMAVIALLVLGLGLSIEKAIVVGALVSLSSTAVVLRVYGDRDALDTPHGRIIVGILIFQDLAIVPLMLVIRTIGGTDSSAASILTTIGVSLVVVAGLLLTGRYVVPWLLKHLARFDARELFTLAIMLFGLGAAVLTARFGLSLALGAFLAGLIISESDYGSQAMSDVLPFRDTFSGIFFISVGMLLDAGMLIENPLPVLFAVATVVLIKAIVTTGATLTLRRPLQVSLMTGIALAQIGEFSFVLATVALPLGLLTAAENQLFLGTAVITMLATPFLIAAAPVTTRRLCRALDLTTLPSADEATDAPDELRDHVIIVGYGVNGRNVARVVDGVGIPYIIVEQNGRVVESAQHEGQPIVYGDATQVHTLERVGVARARVLVLAIASPSDELRSVAIARQLNPGIRIVVRTRFVKSIGELEGVGADEVIAEEFETSLEIFSRVLRHYEVPSNVIEREVHAARMEHYGLALGTAETPAGGLDALASLGVHRALSIVEVEPGSEAEGEHPAALGLRARTGATVVAIARDGEAHVAPGPEFTFRTHDSVVLVGEDEALTRARLVFLAQGSESEVSA
ncbi:MAG: cation:proton antiporter [Gemmatimonadota bacterium]